MLHEVSGSENKSQWIMVVYTHIEIYTHSWGPEKSSPLRPEVPLGSAWGKFTDDGGDVIII